MKLKTLKELMVQDIDIIVKNVPEGKNKETIELAGMMRKQMATICAYWHKAVREEAIRWVGRSAHQESVLGMARSAPGDPRRHGTAGGAAVAW